MSAENAPDPQVLDAQVEALLFSSEVPLPAHRLASLTGAAKGRVLEAVDRLNVHYGETGRAFRIAEVAGGHQMVTVPEHGELLSRLHKEQVPTRLSKAALETLSIIAFKQPVTRAEVDRIRGVSASDGVLRHLMERKVVRIAGRAEAPGRPLLYGTTREFLAYFGLGSVSDLPRTEELEALLAGDAPRPPDEDEELLEGAAEAPAPAARVVHEDEGIEEAGEEAEEEREVEEGIEDEGERPPHAESSSAEGESHSGEESDDREGVPSP